MTRVAAIDCGTNSLRLLVAERTPEGGLVDVSRQMRVVRLGAGVDRTGRIAPDALARTLSALRDYAADIAHLGAVRTRMVATSATRDAANRAEFVEGVREVLGAEPEVLSGAEEAALSFAGATAELAGGPFASPYLVVDIGGGSTELVLGSAAPEASASVDVGCVRLTERHLHADPPTAAQRGAVVADVTTALARVREQVPVERAATFVGLAGTVTTVVAIALGLPGYDPARIHHARVSSAAVREVADRLASLPAAGRAVLPAMHPGRVDVIVAGAEILATTVEQLGFSDVVASEHDILDGIALGLLGRV